MPEAVVIGVAGSAGERIAARLADALRTTCSVGDANAGAGVVLTWPPESLRAFPPVVVFVDDLPRDQARWRPAVLGALARARATGRQVRVFFTEKAATSWVREVAHGGLPTEGAPLRRIYLASGESAASAEFAQRLAETLGLPLVAPEAGHPGHEYEGWGPRYERLAREESWLIHSPTWHAAEALCEAADLVVLIERPAVDPHEEFPAPLPQAKKWQRMFAPWLKRYPVVEARLLEREIERRGGPAPILRLRTAEERDAILDAFALVAGAKAP